MKSFLAVGLVSALAFAGCQSSARPATIEAGIAFVDVAVVDMIDATAKPHMTVVVEGGRVMRIAPASALRLGPAVQRIDGAGKFLMPGLWDMHAHVASRNGGGAGRALAFYASYGVVGVRDMGMLLDQLPDVRAIAAGDAGLPDVIVAGPVLDGPKRPYQPSVALTAETAEEARISVARLAAAGVDFLKPYDGLSPDQYKAVAEAAKAANLKLAGHVPMQMTLEQVTAAGQTSIEHATPKLIEDCTADGAKAMPAMLTAWIQKGPEGKYREIGAWYGKRDSAACETLYKRIAQRGAYVVPTLALDFVGGEWTTEADLGNMPAAGRTGCETLVKQVATAAQDAIGEGRRAVLDMTRDLHRAGVVLLAGTDAPNPCVGFGRSLHTELRLLHEAGLSNLESLKTATVNPARFLGRQDEGVVREGAIANLLLLDADPLQDVGNTLRIAGSMKAGHWRNAVGLAALRK